MDSVAVIGLGAMGRAIAANLLARGCAAAVYNRTPGRAVGLAGQVRVAASPADAAKGAAFIVTMVADDAALEAVVEGKDGLLAAMDADAIHVSMSTVGVAAARRMTERHAQAKRHFISAPVFGRPPMAGEGKLRIVAAGPASAIERARPLLEQMSQNLFVIGTAPEQANVIKLAGNVALAAMAETLAETFTFVKKSGIAPERFLEVINANFASPMYQNYGTMMVQEKFGAGGFKLGLAHKDLKLAQAAAAEVQAPMPVLATVEAQLLAGMARGMGELDLTAVVRVVAANAGL